MCCNKARPFVFLLKKQSNSTCTYEASSSNHTVQHSKPRFALTVTMVLTRAVFTHIHAKYAVSIIYNADKLNRIAAQYWKAFSRQNYFQENGVFISAVVSAPLLLTMFIILLNYVLQSIDSLVEMKRRELLYKARQQHHRENKGTAGTLGKNTKGQGKKTR